MNNESSEIMTFEEALDFLKVSKSLLYKLTSGRKIRHFKTNGGRLLRFRKSDLEGYLLSTEVRPIDQLKME